MGCPFLGRGDLTERDRKGHGGVKNVHFYGTSLMDDGCSRIADGSGCSNGCAGSCGSNTSRI